jgi:hypothetical protein
LRLAACDYPVIVADCISKSTLRIALHQLMNLKLNDVYYFPSFEILKWLAPMVDVIWYEDNMLAHIQKRWTDYTISTFMESYCVGETALPPPLA